MLTLYTIITKARIIIFFYLKFILTDHMSVKIFITLHNEWNLFNFFVNEIRCMQEYLLKLIAEKMFYSKKVKVFGYTDSGDKFLDCASGIAVNILGHCNKKLVKVLTEQVRIYGTLQIFTE